MIDNLTEARDMLNEEIRVLEEVKNGNSDSTRQMDARTGCIFQETKE